MRAELRRLFGAVGGGERRLRAAALAEPDGADQPCRERLGDRRSGQPQARGKKDRRNQQSDQSEQADPLDGALPALRAPDSVSGTQSATLGGGLRRGR